MIKKIQHKPDQLRLIGWAIFSLALILRLVYFFQSSDNPLLYVPQVDEKYYVDFGKSLQANWLGDQPAYFLDPLYGYFLGIIFFLFGDNLTIIRIIQILIDALNAVLLFKIGTKIWNIRVGVIAGLLYACYSVAFFYSILILKTTLTTSILLVYVFACIKCFEKPKYFYWFLLGLLASVAVYLRANLILLIPLTFISLLMVGKKHLVWMIKASLSFLFGLSILFNIVGLRNLYVGDEFRILIANSSYTFYGSNNPENPTGTYKPPAFIKYNNPEYYELYYKREAEKRLGIQLTSQEVSSYWMEQSIKYLQSDWWIFPKLLLYRAGRLFGNFEIPNNHSFELSKQFSFLTQLPLPNFAFAISLGIPGLLLLGIKSKQKTVILLYPIIIVIITSLIFYSCSRFRFPAVPILLLGAAYLIGNLKNNLKDKKRFIIPISVVIVFLSSMSLNFNEMSPNSGILKLAWAYATIGELDKARETARKLNDEEQAKHYALLGYVELLEKNFEKSIEYNTKVIEMEPYNEGAYANLAVAYIETNQAQLAIPKLTRAHYLSLDARYLCQLSVAHSMLGNVQLAARFFDICRHDKKVNKTFVKKIEEKLLSNFGFRSFY